MKAPAAPAPCPLCRGGGEVAGVALVPCCGGHDPWAGVFCGCGGGPVPKEAWRPCPHGCAPPDPAPAPPDPDPFGAW